MSIKDRKLKIGTKLVAQYKRTEHQATVVKGEGDKVRYRLANGKEFSSPSAAGSEVMDGVACNGWRFWSVKGSEEAKPKVRGRGGPGRPKRRKAEPDHVIASASVAPPSKQLAKPEGKSFTQRDVCPLCGETLGVKTHYHTGTDDAGFPTVLCCPCAKGIGAVCLLEGRED
ncbi:hypothetical protein LCGC14_2642700 [marine sediment metagenome]|uniref:Uncharacterized protein n=1 Tax=marine sediment metagenome TaxID=412755 RepID=A0A0F8ZX90_9ZZZZ